MTENMFLRSREKLPRSLGTRESILIVEDSPLSSKLAKALFTAEGYEVRTASSAREAIAVLRRFRPDVVLTDLRMPDVDGVDLARRIKADPLSKRLVVLATSADRDVDEEHLHRAGCDGFVPKPIEVDRVRATTARLRDARSAGLARDGQPGRTSDPDSRWTVTDAIRRATRKLGMKSSAPELPRFLSRSAADLNSLRRAAAHEDTEQMGWIAHRLGGLSAMFGAARVARVCLDLARRARSGLLDCGTAGDLDRLATELESVRMAFGELGAAPEERRSPSRGRR